MPDGAGPWQDPRMKECGRRLVGGGRGPGGRPGRDDEWTTARRRLAAGGRVAVATDVVRRTAGGGRSRTVDGRGGPWNRQDKRATCRGPTRPDRNPLRGRARAGR